MARRRAPNDPSVRVELTKRQREVLALISRGATNGEIAVSNPYLNNGYPFEQVTVPTLAFHAKDDRWGPFSKAQAIARSDP